jgi:trehalose-phosphatase
VSARRAVVILDFDGTLAPIVASRLAPVLARPARAMLARRARVAVLSGRALSDLRMRVGLAGLVYGGCHGLEVAGDGWRFRHPRARPRALAGARRALAAGAARLPGARVEWKGLAVAFHYRRVPPARRPAVRALVRELERRLPGLTVIPGNRVYDFIPRVGWDKGTAARWIARRARAELGGRTAVLYAGDDTTDEAAFRRLRRSGVTIRVGGGATAAEFALRSVADVHALLGWLARALA